MLSTGENWIMIFGVLLGIIFIVSSVFYINKLFSFETKDILVKFVLTIFTSLVALFIVDKLIAFKIPLLAQEQNNHYLN